jgi:RNA polymerase-binding transcription factor DksA
MTPASKGAQVKRVPASRPAASPTSRAGNKKSKAKVDPTSTKRSAPTKKKAAPVVKKAATAAKKPASPMKKPATVAPKKAAPASAKKAVATKKAAPAARKPAPAAKKAAPAKKAASTSAASTSAAAKTAADKSAAKKAGAASRAAAANGAAAVAAPARTTFTPKPKAPPPVRPKTGPYAKDLKFLDEVRELLVADRAIYQEQATSLRAEADSLALEREPGDVQFDEESGEGGTVTVDRERNLALSGQASLAVEEIDYALKRIDDKTYGYCERCFQPIPKPRLRALPYARLCVACKSGGLSRR